VIDSGPNVLSFSIRFRGFTALDLAALMNSGTAIQVSGPNGYSQLAKATSTTLSADGSSVVVTFTAPPPGQNLESSDNGTYTVTIKAGSLFDSVGHELSGPVDSSFTVSVPEQAPSEIFVTNLYRELLHRKPDSAGLQFWSGLVDQHINPQEIVRGIQGSPEYRTVEVQDAYQKLLHRSADPAGLGFFIGLLTQGGAVEQVESIMLGSAEYFQTRGAGTDAGFVDSLYHDLLNRDVDSAGASFFGGLLAQGAAHDAIGQAIQNSAEALQLNISGYYQALLTRAADPAGLAFWLTSLKQGQHDIDVLAGILGSSEYFQNVTAP
jgi:hypothetical protein